MKRSLWCILGILLIMACTPKVPSQFIQPGEMDNILYDYHLAQAMVKEITGRVQRHGKVDILSGRA